MTRRALILGCALNLPACTDRLATSDGDDTTGPASSTGEPSTGTGPTSGTVPTTGEATETTDEPATTSGTTSPVDPTGTTSETTDATTLEPDTTTGTSTSDTDTTTSTSDPGTDTDPELPPPACPSLCERTTVHMGNLKINPADSTADLVCVTEVTGTVSLSGPIDEAALAGLSGLEKVGGLFIGNNDALTGLAPFSCLREVDELHLSNVPALVDLSSLSGLTALRSFRLSGTGVTALPELTAPQLGLQKLELGSNPALQDLDALATWNASTEVLSVNLTHMPALTSIAGLEGLLLDSANGTQDVYLENLAQLGSLAGLEPLDFPNWLYLLDLPKISDLSPLAQLKSTIFLHLNGMPLVKSLTGLGQVTHLEFFVLGGCVNGGPDAGGMNGLTSLAGLDELMSVGSLAIGNSAKLNALTGAPALQEVEDLHLVNNAQLADADVAALLAQLAQPPATSCVGEWGECECIVIQPP